MADTTLEQVEELAMQLAPEDQRLLIANLVQRLIKHPVSDSNLRDAEIRKVLDETRGAWGTGKTLDEIDQEINAMRERDWSRDWKIGNA